MTAQDIQCGIEVPVSATQAYDAIARVSDWWAKDFTGSARNLGNAFTVRWGETFVDFKIAEAIPGRRVVWQVVNCHLHSFENQTEWNGTSVVWEISQANGKTNITLTHHGLTPDVGCYNMCQKGWSQYVEQSLLQLLSSGKGLPR
jgi:hypothetical protein